MAVYTSDGTIQEAIRRGGIPSNGITIGVDKNGFIKLEGIPGEKKSEQASSAGLIDGGDDEDEEDDDIEVIDE
ncbi:hypothetical protein UCRPA7_1911 [Phaeoacremonium minimum UCRPA7]|uniref:Uncharacterized protein n=1 Tax=Phaeoacremonium minimum (strain UCR-PA7) TaxID=1286976 RepID=R8BTE8_PHAM7|nr:hypothetical protein UCRPA7_1911 [Phaeoacremonium minimum UCRPA7]EOO02550.1 hypothetical protein UCRPA7_1911 [Phaeoacremonium minimum UCRPA7]